MTKQELSGEELKQALDALRGGNRTVLLEAARRLASNKGLAVTLLQMLKEESRVSNRHGILYALSWQGDVRVWWPLLKVLANVNEVPLVRGQAAEGIAYLFWRKRQGSLAYRIAIELLTWTLSDTSAEVRYYALFALGASKDPAVIPTLRAMTEDDGRSDSIVGTVGQEAQKAIRWILDSQSAHGQMDSKPNPESGDWDALRSLADEARATGRIVASPEQRELLQRTAGEVALLAEQTAEWIASAEGTARLVLEVWRRIRNGSRKLSRAIAKAREHRDAGRLEEARRVLQRVIDDEQAPFCRESAAAELQALDAEQ